MKIGSVRWKDPIFPSISFFLLYDKKYIELWLHDYTLPHVTYGFFFCQTIGYNYPEVNEKLEHFHFTSLLSLSLSLSLCLCLCLSLSLSFSLYLSFSLSLCLSFFLSLSPLSVSVSFFIFLSLYLYLSLSFSLPVSLVSLCLYVSLSLSLSISFSLNVSFVIQNNNPEAAATYFQKYVYFGPVLNKFLSKVRLVKVRLCLFR